MGVWGTGIFEDDAAMAYLSGLADHPENAGTVLREALETAAHMDDGALDPGEGSEALAAAALVSLAKGGSPVEAPDTLEAAVRRICRHVPKNLAPLAVEAIDKVLGDQSELRERWADADCLDEWRAEPQAVRHHLATA